MGPCSCRLLVLAALWLGAFAAVGAAAADRSGPAGWRTDGSGAYPQARPPLEWSTTRNVVWATPMPSKSNSQPAITGDRLFVCAEPDWLLCLRLADGEILWQRPNSDRQAAPADEWERAEVELAAAAELEQRRTQLNTELEGLADGGPAADAVANTAVSVRREALTREIAALDARLEGLPLALKWRKLPTHEQMNGYTTATPVTDGRHVWAVFGNAVVACYDLNGQRRWIRKLPDRPHAMFGHSASPLLLDGKLIVTVEDTVALDAVNGEELWRTRYGQSWGSPIRVEVAGETFIALANGRLIRAADGRVVGRGFNLADGSPVFDRGILYAVQSRGGAIRLPARAGDKLELERLWETDPKGGKHYASPVLHEGLIYTVSGTGIYSVIDAADGQVVLEKRLDLGRGTMYPSVVLAGEHVLLSSDNGTTLVLQTGREYREVARNRLEPFISTPIVHGDRIYVRTFAHVWCIAGT